MNPELMKLLSLGQTAPPSVAGTPIANAIKKMMGSGGSASVDQQASPQAPMPYDQTREDQQVQGSRGNEMLRDRAYSGQTAAEQSMRSGEADIPMSTEEELEMARKNMGGGRHLERAQQTNNDLQSRLTRQRQH